MLISSTAAHTLESVLASWIKGFRIVSKPYFSRFSVLTQATSCIDLREERNFGSIFPRR